MASEHHRRAARSYLTGTGSQDRRSSLHVRPLTCEYENGTTLKDVVESLDLQKPQEDLGNISFLLENVIILNDYFLYLQQSNNIGAVAPEVNVALRLYLSEALLPPSSVAEHPPYEPGKRFGLQKPTEEKLAKFHLFTDHAFGVLELLESWSEGASKRDLIPYWTCLAAFTDPEDIWTSDNTCAIACKLLDQDHTPQDKSGLSELMKAVLEEQLKPQFSRTRQTSLTEQARKVITPLSYGVTTREDDRESKPWKYSRVYLPRVFHCVLRQTCQLDSSFIESNWPLLVPPILTLINDSSIKHKAAGCSDLWLFLEKCPTAMLGRTGLGEVFAEAMMPCLMYLPTLTDEADSILLLTRAYPALIRLASVRFPGPHQRGMRMRSLDRIMRYGILKGFANAGEYVQIVKMLMDQVATIIGELGIDVAKHIRHIVSICTTNLINPFGVLYPPLQVASLDVLKQLLTNAWPRMSYYFPAIFKGLAVCWLQLEEESMDPKDKNAIRERGQVVMNLLLAVRSRDPIVKDDFLVLLQSEPRLGSLINPFPEISSDSVDPEA